VTRGQLLVLASDTVTNSLVSQVDAALGMMTADSKENVTIAVYGYNKPNAVEELMNAAKKHNVTIKIGVSVAEKTNSVAVVSYDETEAEDIVGSVKAEYARIVHIEQPKEYADNRVTAAMVILAIFNVEFKQFAQSLQAAGIDIGISEDDMNALFASSDMVDGIVRIKPVEVEEMQRINRLVKGL